MGGAVQQVNVAGHDSVLVFAAVVSRLPFGDRESIAVAVPEHPPSWD